MDRKIRVAAVSYLNTKPLIYGFEKGMMKDEIDLVIDYPSKVADLLLNNEADIGLVPVSILPLMKEKYIISDYCIGSNGEVGSVGLFSDVPLNEIKKVLLDYQSRTSVALLQLLLQEHWKISPALVHAKEGFEEHIRGTTAGLVIGDRALKQRKKSGYIYDLGTAWKEMTGLPFVFAVWAANKKLPDNFGRDFNTATALGLKNLEIIIAFSSFPAYDLMTYYTKNIDYKLDGLKRQAIDHFLEKQTLL